MVALWGIAVTLCSMLFVALPTTAIAAAAEDDGYVLGIYGNANEDDTIDMRDLTYVKLIFFGKKPETELADAKYDGTINPLDFIQIKLIIVGKEKELTVVDSVDRIVTVKKPVERIIPLQCSMAALLRSIGIGDKVVGVASDIEEAETFFPEISKLPSVGLFYDPDCEAILELKPDIVVQHSFRYTEEFEEKLEPAGIVALYLNSNWPPPLFTEQVKKFGYIVDKREEAEEFIDWYQDYLNTITESVEELSEEDKPRVFYGFSSLDGPWTMTDESVSYGSVVEMAGGINIAGDLSGEWIEVEQEWVLEQNPSLILWDGYSVIGYGYEVDDPSKAATLREDIISHFIYNLTTAAQEGDVYIISGFLEMGCHPLVVAYVAKLFHPELFEDLDPESIHQEYLTRFQHLDYDVYEHGVFVYPMQWNEYDE